MRCIRTVKALRAYEGSDLVCVALYTDVERDAPFVRHADLAVRLKTDGGNAVSAYLDHAGVLAALRHCQADAVWPGWGFVAESADFVDRVTNAGLRFLGPSGDVMRAVGDKIGAKQVAEAAGVPVIPWSGGAIGDEGSAHADAEQIGYPLVLKASAGGGGRGIRVVERPEQLADAFRSARSEALSAFGDERVFMEKHLRGGRHVEVQIAADLYGAVGALGCRDCSVQRRHQKILEEAPPPNLDPSLIEELEDCAVRLARRVGYSSVGTVEFLVADDGFAFLEVNPRLQVEHGITEELYAVDLVERQIRIARGEPLPDFPRATTGCAIEARVCAEDPEADFLPAPGRIARFDPALGPQIRVDTGVAAGSNVPAEFDSLIAKVIATGETRGEARARLVTALEDFELVVEDGATNKGYLIDLLESPTYRSAEFDTEWLDRSPVLREGSQEFAVEALVAASVLSYQRARDDARRAFWSERRWSPPRCSHTSALAMTRGARSGAIRATSLRSRFRPRTASASICRVRARAIGSRCSRLAPGVTGYTSTGAWLRSRCATRERTVRFSRWAAARCACCTTPTTADCGSKSKGARIASATSSPAWCAREPPPWSSRCAFDRVMSWRLASRSVCSRR